MNLAFIQRNLKFFIVGFCLLLVVGITFILLIPKLEPKPVRIVSTQPDNGALDVDVNSPIVITFDQNLNESPIHFELNPPMLMDSKQQNNQLTLQPTQGLQSNTHYTLFITMKNGQTVGKIEWTTKHLQGDSIETQVDYAKNNYPLLSVLPFENENFAINYLGPLHIRIIAKKSPSNQYQQQALDWIKQQGVDPKTHKIDFYPQE